jgi:hypothetical protein
MLTQCMYVHVYEEYACNIHLEKWPFVSSNNVILNAYRPTHSQHKTKQF